MDYALTKKELATIAGYTYRQLYNIDLSLPEDRKLFVPSSENDNKYDLVMFVKRWVDFNVAREIPDTFDLDEVKAKHEIIKTEKTQLEVDKLKGKLIDVNDVKRLWANIANTVMQNMMHLPDKLAPMLKMMENTDTIKSIMDDEIRKVLNSIADTPLPDYVDTDTEEGEEEEE